MQKIYIKLKNFAHPPSSEQHVKNHAQPLIFFGHSNKKINELNDATITFYRAMAEHRDKGKNVA